MSDKKKVFEKTLEDYREQVWGCARCNWCQNQWGWNVKSAEFSEICPAFSKRRSFAYSGMGKMHISRALLEGDFSYEDSSKLLEIAYYCTTCGACEMNCLRLMEKEPLKITEALRYKLVADGIGPMPEHKNLINSVRTYDNPWLQPRTRKDRWAKGLGIKDINKEKADTLYYAGCTAAFDPALQQVCKDTVAILKKAGVDLGILGSKEVCCGSPIARIGDRELFFELARRNVEMFNKLGVNKIVTSCPGCYRVLKFDYPEVPGIPDGTYEVLHTVEFIDRLVKEGKLHLTRELPIKATWHDPCHLGRHCGIYESPRDVLRAIPGLEFLEMERNRDQAFCCGGGGGVRTAFIDFAVDTARERLKEVKKTTGAEALVTCCPFCEQNFADAITKDGEKIKLYDLTDLVLQAI